MHARAQTRLILKYKMLRGHIAIMVSDPATNNLAHADRCTGFKGSSTTARSSRLRFFFEIPPLLLFHRKFPHYYSFIENSPTITLSSKIQPLLLFHRKFNHLSSKIHPLLLFHRKFNHYYSFIENSPTITLSSKIHPLLLFHRKFNHYYSFIENSPTITLSSKIHPLLLFH